MKTQAVVVANDPIYQSWLQNAAGSTMDVALLPMSGGQDALTQIEARGRVDVVFVEFDSHDVAQRAAFVERLLERHGQIPVVGLGADDNPQWVLAAMRAGARDFFVLHRDDTTLGLQIGRLLRRSSAAPKNAPQRPTFTARNWQQPTLIASFLAIPRAAKGRTPQRAGHDSALADRRERIAFHAFATDHHRAALIASVKAMAPAIPSRTRVKDVRARERR